MSDAFGGFGVPNDAAQWLAVLLGALVPLVLPKACRLKSSSGAIVAVAAAAAAGLSAAYVELYLRGGPRIIDATAYWLQARALADGWLAWPLADPEQAVLGRFLLQTPHAIGLAATPAHTTGVAVIFPPGYPAVLALGMALGTPLAVGPALAASLVVATGALARQVERSAAGVGIAVASPQAKGDPILRIAVCLSVVCAALRYHTADTMSHGLAALCFVVALTAALTLAAPGADHRTRPHSPAAPSSRWVAATAALVGLAAGWLLTTRPVSALALSLTLAALAGAATRQQRLAGRWPSLLGGFAVGVIPGFGLWFLHQYAATGTLSTTAQAAYYAVSDGPPGCFAYGFGADVGCLGEHGTFVRHRLADGFGALAALGTTARRLEMHLSDVLNFPPLFCLVPVGAWLGRSIPAVRFIALAVCLQIACYVPFYFDGNYPGGGGRMYADILPLEHVLAATAIGLLAARAPRGRPSFTQLASATLALALIGFAIHSGRAHAQLRDREGGRPMFERTVLAPAGVNAGLVYFDTDHGFNLAHRPGGAAVQAVRYHADDLDRLVWEAHGRPPSFRYRYDFDGIRGPQLESLDFAAAGGGARALRIEAESLWPPASQHDGWAWPRHTSRADASGGRWLAFAPMQCSRARCAPKLTLRLPADTLRDATIQPRLCAGSHTDAPAEPLPPVLVHLRVDERIVHTWRAELEPGSCRDLNAVAVPSSLRTLDVVIHSRNPVAVDCFEVQRAR